MGCKVIVTPRGKLGLRLHWRVPELGTRRTQISLGVAPTAKNRDAAARDYAGPITAEMRARRFTMALYLEWFPTGALADEFRRRLGIVQAIATNNQPTIATAYQGWIASKQPPYVRASARRDYVQHMTGYVEPAMGHLRFDEVSTDLLRTFRLGLKRQRDGKALSAKTARNIFSTFQVFWGDRAPAGLADPFERLEWAVKRHQQPDPFTLPERNTILAWFKRHRGGHFHPFVATLFLAGLRPSEATARRVKDFDPKRNRLRIHSSRYMGEENAPKTKGSHRAITLTPELATMLRRHVEGRGADEFLFVNLAGQPISAKNWQKEYWHRALEDVEVRYRKWYATRHTSISHMLSRGGNLLAVARYHGTSVLMIERSYGEYLPPEGGGVVDCIPGIGRKRNRKAGGLRLVANER